jgi:site-specific recombinase XerD
MEENSVSDFLSTMSTMSRHTAKEYAKRLNSFRKFTLVHYGESITIDNLIIKIKEGSENPYSVLNSYAAYLLKGNNVSNLTLKQWIVTAKNLFEYHDVDISPRKFKMKVKLPKVIRKKKEALSKEDIVDILNTCSDIRLRTYVMLLAATGMRAVEALSIRIKDLDFQSNPPKLFVRGEFTKTRYDRTIFLTSELSYQLSSWVHYKYRSRRVCYSNNNGKTFSEYRTPQENETDLVFSVYQSIKNPNPDNLYAEFCTSFAKTLDRMGRGMRDGDSANGGGGGDNATQSMMMDMMRQQMMSGGGINGMNGMKGMDNMTGAEMEHIMSMNICFLMMGGKMADGMMGMLGQ